MGNEFRNTADNHFWNTDDNTWYAIKTPISHFRTKNIRRPIYPGPPRAVSYNMKPYMFSDYQEMMRSIPDKPIHDFLAENQAILPLLEKPYLSKDYQDMKYREPTPDIGNVLDPAPETTLAGWAPIGIEWPELDIPCHIFGYVGNLPTAPDATFFKVTLTSDSTEDGIEVYDRYVGEKTNRPSIKIYASKWMICAGGSGGTYNNVSYIDIEIYSLNAMKKETGATKPHFFKYVAGTGWTAFTIVNSALGERSLRSGQTIVMPPFQCY